MNQKINVLRLRSYFYPEQVSPSHLVNDLDQAFFSNNIYSINITPTPSRGLTKKEIKLYKKKKYELSDNCMSEVHRFNMVRESKNTIQRAIRYFFCCIAEYRIGTKIKDVDLLYCGSTPPIQGALCAKVKKKLSKKYKRTVPFIYNLQDIFPDSLVNANMTKKGSLIWKIGRKIENYTYKNADKIIVISDNFKKNLIEKGVPEEKIVVVPNWIDSDKVIAVERENNVLFERYNLDKNNFYICYSGNIGLSQNLELLLDAAEILQNEFKDLVFVLIGEGVAKNMLENAIIKREIKNVKTLPFQPYEEISHVFSLGDVDLIISKPGIGKSSVPSKTWSIMAAERPILASFDLDSELSDVIKKVNCGITVEAGKLDEFVSAIKYLYNNRFNIQEMGKAGRNYVVNYLNKDKCVEKYINTIKDTVKNK